MKKARVPEHVTLELQPRTNTAWQRIHSMCHNPHLRLRVKSDQKLANVIQSIERKWIPNSTRLVSLPLPIFISLLFPFQPLHQTPPLDSSPYSSPTLTPSLSNSLPLFSLCLSPLHCIVVQGRWMLMHIDIPYRQETSLKLVHECCFGDWKLFCENTLRDQAIVTFANRMPIIITCIQSAKISLLNIGGKFVYLRRRGEGGNFLPLLWYFGTMYAVPSLQYFSTSVQYKLICIIGCQLRVCCPLYRPVM